jgi:hypothetical protein
MKQWLFLTPSDTNEKYPVNRPVNRWLTVVSVSMCAYMSQKAIQEFVNVHYSIYVYFQGLSPYQW